MSGFNDEMAAALEAVRSGSTPVGADGGSDPENVVYTGGGSINASEERENAVDSLFSFGSDSEAEGSEVADQGTGEGDQSELSLDDSNQEISEDSDGSETSDDTSTEDGSLEELTVTDDKGRRKVKVDFSDRDKLKKYVRMAHGARKWQAERDSARGELKDVSGKLSELQTNWTAIEDAYQSGGVRGLVELLDGAEGYSKFEQSLVERHELRRNASPQELEALETREAAERQARELENIRKENESFREKMEKEREQSEIKALESRIHPAFDRFRFKGKLGDQIDEHMFDQMLWNSAMHNLKPYEEKGIAITQEIAEKEFARVANTLRKRMKANVDKSITKSVTKKKEEATATAQRGVMRGVRDNAGAGEAEKMIQDGNISGLLKNWGKYGKLFG